MTYHILTNYTEDLINKRKIRKLKDYENHENLKDWNTQQLVAYVAIKNFWMG